MTSKLPQTRTKKTFLLLYTLAFVCLLFLATTSSAAPANGSKISILTLPNLIDWKPEKFSGETLYEVVNLDNQYAIKATSNGTASGLVRKITVDLNKTPYLNWSWKVDGVLEGVDETQKSGDDYAARVYVVISGGLFFWRTRAISYAWASKQPKNTAWPNAFTDRAIMVALQSGSDLAGQWITEKRNILQDIKDLLGKDGSKIDAVAIMTDTDDSKQSATAYYGDIYFSAK